MPRFRVAGVVIEIIRGIIIGPSVLGWAKADEPVQTDAPTVATVTDFSVQLTLTPVHAGVNKFVIRNGGPSEHEFIGFKIDQPVAELALNSDGNLDEEALTSVTDAPNLAPHTD